MSLDRPPVHISSAALSPNDVAGRTFATVRRGYDPDAVRRFLDEVAALVRQASQREAELHSRLAEAERRAANPQLDEATLTAAVGVETARVLQAAHDAAREVAARAEAEAAALRSEAESLLAERTRAAEAEAEQILARARSEAEALQEAAERRAEAVHEESTEQCRAMVAEAREARRRVLADLAGRRRTLHLQLEQLRAGKDTLLGAVEAVAAEVESLRARLAGAEQQARDAADDVAEQLAAEGERASGEDLAGLSALSDELVAETLLAAEQVAREAATASDELEAVGGAGAPGTAAAPAAAEPAAAEPAAAEAAITEAATTEAAITEAATTEAATRESAAGESAAEELGIASAQTAPAEQTAPSEQTAPAEQTAQSEETAPSEEMAPSEETAPAEETAAAEELDVGAQPAPAAERGLAVAPAEAAEPAGAAQIESGAASESETASVEEGVQAAHVATAAAPGRRGGRRNVDELFAKIRANRAQEVAQAHKVLDAHLSAPSQPSATSRGAATIVADEAPRAQEGPGGGVPGADTVPGADEAEPLPSEEAGDGPTGTAAAVARRDELLTATVSELARRLKRALLEEQNEVLDALRHRKKDDDPATLVLESLGAERLAEAAAGALGRCHAAGRSFAEALTEPGAQHLLEPEAEPAPAALRSAGLLAAEITEQLLGRLSEGIEELAGEQTRIPSLVGSVYREWKGERVERVAADYANRAFSEGVSEAAARAGLLVRWLVDDSGGGCPDCDDNELAGPLAVDDEFPTGHLRPPVHPGCRCLLVPVLA